MKLSIVIVHYNTPQFLSACLESLTGDRGIPHDWEIVVVDNASSDHAAADLLELRDTYSFTLIRNDKNEGFSRANNAAIKRSTGEYVLLLNPDTEASKDALTRVMSYMDEHEKVGIATPRVELPGGAIDDACHRGFPTPWNSLCHFSGLAWMFPTSTFFNGYHLGYQDMEKIHEIDAGVGACMMIRRTVGDRLGWLDEDYFWYGEDIDICYRAKQAGYLVVYIPDVAILHHKGVSSGIKKESQGISSATHKTRMIAQKARFNAMRMFYKKHYEKKYPPFMFALVMKGIDLFEKVVISSK